MKHNWEEFQPKDITKCMSSNHHRRCLNCGKEQSKESNQLWGRVVGYSWQPLAGKCKATKENNNAGT